MQVVTGNLGKNKSPHPEPAASSSRVAGGCTKATERSQGLEGDLWATLLGQTFSSSGVFLGLQQLKHQKSLKTPNQHPAGCFKHLPVDLSQLPGCLPCQGCVAWHPPGGYPTDPALLSPKAEEGAGCRGEKAASPGHSKGKAQIYCTLPAAPLGLLWDPRGQAPSGQGCAAGRTGLGGSSCGKSGLSTLHINAPCAVIAVGPLEQSH